MTRTPVTQLTQLVSKPKMGRPRSETFVTARKDKDGKGEWVHIAEASRRIGTSRARVYQLVSQKRLRAKKLDGSLLYVHADDVAEYKQRQEDLKRLLKV